MTREYCDYVIDLLAQWGRVVGRAMFGGYGLYYQGHIFAIVVDDVLYFKVTEKNRAAYEAAGAEPFAYEGKGGKRVTMSYWTVPLNVMEDGELLVSWAEQSYQVARGMKT